MKIFLLAALCSLLVGCAGVPFELKTPWVDLSSSKSGEVSIYPKPVVIPNK
jgi:starvation-inducible outer membrane lipoprotein